MHADKARNGATAIAVTLRQNGHQALFAGGCVRDLLLDRQPKDWDIATSATPEQIQKIFPRTFAVGAAFGVVRVLHNEEDVYEVATFRSDGDYSDGRHPEKIQYSSSPQEDVKRRDFTVNALLMDPQTDEILDYVGGHDDLNKKLIRAVGDPQRRFSEDRLRMLRAVRFAARLNFTIEENTRQAIALRNGDLTGVSAERITQELEGIFLCNYPGRGIELIEQTKLTQSTLPDCDLNLLAQNLDSLHIAAQENNLDARQRLDLAWALVYQHVQTSDIDPILRTRKLSKQSIRTVQELVTSIPLLSNPENFPLAKYLRLLLSPEVKLSRALLQSYFLLNTTRTQYFDARLHEIQKNPPNLSLRLSGADLQKLGLRPGPSFKLILSTIEDEILEGKLNSPKQTQQRALELAQDPAPTQRSS